MTDPYLLLAASRQSELAAAARRDALVRLARCCRPSAVRGALQGAAARLGALRHGRTAACCA